MQGEASCPNCWHAIRAGEPGASTIGTLAGLHTQWETRAVNVVHRHMPGIVSATRRTSTT